MHAILTFALGDTIAQQVVLRPGQVFVVGRGKDVAVRLEDREVSRRHAALELRSEGLVVTDLGSSNGTFVDGVGLGPREPALVPPGAPLRIGAYRVTAELVVDGEDRPAWHHEDAALLPPDEFALLEVLGRGGNGRVWAAEQKALGRRVAVKVLSADGLQDDPTGRARFLREGRICQRIDSPYVVEVYDVRIVGDVPVIIMELVQGPSAHDLLQTEGGLTTPRALAIGEHVAHALSAAAAVGVVHRDVKPHNILIDPSGVAKLADFGIAKELGGKASRKLTAQGSVLGSLPYAAPEQVVDAAAVDLRTDVYGLGATLYHLVAGRPPFDVDGKVLLQVMRAILQDNPVPLVERRADCPPEVSGLVDAMLAKDPAGRPAMDDVLRRLSGVRAGHQGDPAPDVDLSETDDGLPRRPAR